MKTLLLLALMLSGGADSIPMNVTDSILPQVMQPQILTDMPLVRVVQDSSITQLMQDKIAGIERGIREIPGWRVQVYSSNAQGVAKTEAETLQKQLEEQLDVPVYIVSQQPFWKVRVGNFRSQEEAQRYRELLIQIVPDLQAESYPVRDQIIVEN